MLYKAFSGPNSNIVVPKALIFFMGDDLLGGLFLSQALFWGDKGERDDGWVWQSFPKWEKAFLTRHMVKKYAKVCSDMGFLEERVMPVGDKPKVWHYRINYGKFEEVFMKFLKTHHQKFHDDTIYTDVDLTDIELFQDEVDFYQTDPPPGTPDQTPDQSTEERKKMKKLTPKEVDEALNGDRWDEELAEDVFRNIGEDQQSKPRRKNVGDFQIPSWEETVKWAAGKRKIQNAPDHVKRVWHFLSLIAFEELHDVGRKCISDAETLWKKSGQSEEVLIKGIMKARDARDNDGLVFSGAQSYQNFVGSMAASERSKKKKVVLKKKSDKPSRVIV